MPPPPRTCKRDGKLNEPLLSSFYREISFARKTLRVSRTLSIVSNFCSARKSERVARIASDLRGLFKFSHVSLPLSLSHTISFSLGGYLHTCNPLASGAHFIYETIARASTSEKIAARREESSLAIKFIPRLSPYLNLVRRNILALVVVVVTNSRRRKRGRRGGGGEEKIRVRAMCTYEFVERMTKACSFAPRR